MLILVYSWWCKGKVSVVNMKMIIGGLVVNICPEKNYQIKVVNNINKYISKSSQFLLFKILNKLKNKRIF